MVGAIIGAALGAAGSIFGNMSAAKERRKQLAELEQQEKENQSWYDRRYNEDPTKRASANYLLTKTAETVKNRDKAIQGTQAVMGGTEDSVTAAKEANSKAISDTAAKVVAADDARKDQVEQEYLNTKNNIRNARMGIEERNAQGIAEAVKGVSSAAGSIASSVDGAMDKDNTSAAKVEVSDNNSSKILPDSPEKLVSDPNKNSYA